MWPGTWVTSRTGSVGWDLKSQLSWVPGWEEEGWLSLARRSKASGFVTGVARVLWADGEASIERLCLFPYVEKPFNSKVIKSFVPELRSYKCFSCRDSYVLCIYVMNILCTFHIFMYGYVTISLFSKLQ